jgi:hypothetical protein
LCKSVKQFATEADTSTVTLQVTSFPSEATVWFERLWNWLLTPSRTPSKPPPAAAETAPPATLHALAERIVALEAQNTQLQLAWSETLDKIGRWASKQAARERRRVDRDLDLLAGDDGPIAQDGAGDANGGEPTMPTVPTDRAAQKAQLRARAATLFPRR